MQTCSRCHAQSPDTATNCVSCQADLSEFSETAVALKNYQSNPRIQFVRISVDGNACPACQSAQGTYPKESAPSLPVEGCSDELGCRCFYAPVLELLYP